MSWITDLFTRKPAPPSDWIAQAATNDYHSTCATCAGYRRLIDANRHSGNDALANALSAEMDVHVTVHTRKVRTR